MRILSKSKGVTLAAVMVMAMLFMFTGMLTVEANAGQKMNPCGTEKMNPCGMKKMNPCGMKKMNPCGTEKMNPCGTEKMNPCGMEKSGSDVTPIRKYRLQEYNKVVTRGKRLWADSSLGKSGMSCATCHPNGAKLNAKPYPKYINMADDILTADQMINFCMVNPMKGKRLGWNSQKLTALAAYVTEHSGNSGALNPCGMNPCAKANPCSTKNPCSAKNPCGMK